MSSLKAISRVRQWSPVSARKALRTMVVRATSPKVPMCGRPDGPYPVSSTTGRRRASNLARASSALPASISARASARSLSPSRFFRTWASRLRACSNGQDLASRARISRF